MPFESNAQRKFLFAKHPKIAEEFAAHTPKDADLPEHVKAAEGGEVKDMPYLQAFREYLQQRGAPIATDVNDMDGADKVTDSTGTAKGYSAGGEVESDGLDGIREDLKKTSDENKPPEKDGFQIDLTKPDLDAENKTTKGIFMTERFAKGGVAASNDNAPHKAPEGPSYEEKCKLIEKALKEGKIKMADGGEVVGPQLPPDAPQDSKLQAIMKAIGMAGSDAVSSVLPGTQGLTGVVAPMAANAATAPGVAPVINTALGTNLKGPDVSPVPAPAPVTPSVVSAPAPNAAPETPTASVPPTPDPLAQLGKFDPSTVTPGLNPQDRQALAGQMQANQHTYGNYLSEALAGIGDAVAAKGGVNQNALGNIFALQTQQRQEALDNFDKARQSAVEHFTMKNQADQTLINNLKARGELQVSPGIAHALGHPELAGKPVAQADLVLKTDAMKYDYANKMTERKQAALKNSAEEVDKALTHGGMFGTQKMMSPQQRLNMIHAQAIKNDPEAFGYTVTGGR